MLNTHQILELKHHADKKQREIYQAFKKKIVNDPQRENILWSFGYSTVNVFQLMEIYAKDILSSNEFIYMIAMFENISDECIKAFIDGMTLDDADWAATISKGSRDTLEAVFHLITHGYSKERIETFAEEHYKLQRCEANLWYAINLYNVVIDYPDISIEEIKCCADLIVRARVIYTNTNLFAKLIKMKVDTSELKSFFTHVDTWDYKDEEIIEAFLDFKMLYGN